MAISVIDRLRTAKNKLSAAMPKNRDELFQTAKNAKNWFRNKLKNLIYGKDDNEIEGGDRYSGMRSRISDPFGRLSFFIYKAEYDKKLPYWDAAPLTLLYDEDAEHIYGLNFHYVHPMIRAKILSSLIDYMMNANTERAYLNVSLNRLRGLSTSRYIKPCLKTYLKSNFKTAPVVIKPEFWHNAIMLPTAEWQRSSNNRVWRDSSQQF